MPPKPPANASIPDGWEVVQDTPTQAATGTPDGWEVVEDAAPAPTNWMGGVSALAGAGAAALPVVRRAAEQVATSPMIGGAMARLSQGAGALNVGKLGYDLMTGKNPLQSAWSAVKNEGMRQGAKLAYRAATPLASGLGAEGVAGLAAPVAVPLAGGLAGIAGTAGFLGALQHDANRHVDIDYSKDTPDTAIARVFTNMRNSEANRDRTLDERMDDPDDVMFKPDETATVRGAVLAQLGR